MRRPVAAMCFGMILGCIFVYKISDGICRQAKFTALLILLVSVSVSAVKYYYTGKNKAHRLTLYLFTGGIVIGSVLMLYAINSHGELYYHAGEAADIKGTVVKTEFDESGELSRLKIATADGSKVLASVKGESIINEDITGETVSFRSVISMPAERRNPKCFDYRLYLKSMGIETVTEVNASQIEIIGVSRKPYHRYLRITAHFRQEFTDKLTDKIGSERSGLITAMMFGNKELVSADVYEEFQRNGTAHVLAVSGLHIGAVYAALRAVTGKRRSRANFAVTAAVMFVYAALASFAPSVIRAASMIAVHAYGDLKNRHYDMLSASCLCMAAAVAVNPYIIFNVGFRLSYTAVISICILGRCLGRFIHGSLLPTVSVQASMIAVTAQTFNYFSIGSFIANIPIIFLTGIVVPSGLVMMFLTMLSQIPFFDNVLGIAARFPACLCDMIILINSITYAGGKLTFDVVSPSVFGLIMYLGIIMFVSSELCFMWFKKGLKKHFVYALVILVLFAVTADAACDDGFSRAGLVFVDVGQGDCLHIRTPDGYNCLIDGGGSASYDVGKKTLKPYLLKNGVQKIDMAVVTHLHTDHYGGIVSLCNDGMVNKLCVYAGNIVNEDRIIEETGMSREDILYVKEGDVLELGSVAEAVVMSPPELTETEYEELAAGADENKSSLILKVKYGDISILMTGDISADAEKELAAKYGDGLACTVLKAAHHGSKYSSCNEFTEAAAPRAVVFQVGRNNYGHPDKTLIEKLEEKDIMVYRNDVHGAIGITRIKKKHDIITVIKERRQSSAW